MKLRLLSRLPIVALVTAGLAVGCNKDKPQPPADQQGTPAATAATPTAATAAAGDYEGLASVPNAGTIKGAVTYSGKDTDAKLKITKDNETCCAAPNCKANERPAGALVVTGGKVKNAIVYIADLKKGKKFEPQDVTINNHNCTFDPHVAIGYKGAKVITKNSDAVLHNTHLVVKEGNKDLFNIALPNKDQTIEKPLRKGGLIAVSCDAHDWMKGYLYSAENPYATITGDDGSFTLDNVPPGKHKVTVWHETLGEKQLDVEVPGGGEGKADVAF